MENQEWREENEFHVIDVHGDKINTVRSNATGKVYVDIRTICEALGLDYEEEIRRIRNNPALAGGLKGFDLSAFN